MTFEEYQKQALTTAEYPRILVHDNREPYSSGVVHQEANYLYPTLGLVGETGEVAEKIKKLVRNKYGHFDLEDVKEIGKELGDVLWYVAVLASEFNLDLNDVAIANLSKLQDRAKRNVIKSEGDNR